MSFVKNLKLILFFVSIIACADAKAAFITQPDTIETGNFLLLTPIKKSLADNLKLRTKEHLMINENERVKYQLKNERGTKRGRIIRISDDEIQVYNQVTGQMSYIDIDNLASISRTQSWKAWAGYFSLYSGLSLLIGGIGFGIVAIISAVINGTRNGGADELLIIASIYGTFAILIGTGTTYAATNILYKYRKFKIGKQYKIGTYSMKQLNEK